MENVHQISIFSPCVRAWLRGVMLWVHKGVGASVSLCVQEWERNSVNVDYSWESERIQGLAGQTLLTHWDQRRDCFHWKESQEWARRAISDFTQSTLTTVLIHRQAHMLSHTLKSAASHASNGVWDTLRPFMSLRRSHFTTCKTNAVSSVHQEWLNHRIIKKLSTLPLYKCNFPILLVLWQWPKLKRAKLLLIVLINKTFIRSVLCWVNWSGSSSSQKSWRYKQFKISTCWEEMLQHFLSHFAQFRKHRTFPYERWGSNCCSTFPSSYNIWRNTHNSGTSEWCHMIMLLVTSPGDLSALFLSSFWFVIHIFPGPHGFFHWNEGKGFRKGETKSFFGTIQVQPMTPWTRRTRCSWPPPLSAGGY